VSELPRRPRRLVSDDADLAVVEIGASEAAAVIAHGAGSSARFVEAALASPLADAGLRLVTYDLRGHGASTPARSVDDHHLDVHARDLATVAGAVDGEVVVVGGISLGAHAAVRAVGKGGTFGSVRRGVSEPRAVLACLPAWTGAARRGRGPHAAAAEELAHLGVDGVIERLRSERSLPRWLRHTLVTDYLRHDPRSLVAALTSLDGGEAPSLEEIGELEVPLAVVGWEDDPGHPIEVARSWASMGGGSLVELGLGELEAGVDRLGMAVVEALRAAGVSVDEAR
jgi:pimeloyl-ACP methyl ester carboxylesterase